FSNRAEAAPFLAASPFGTLSRTAPGQPHRIHLRAGYTIEPRLGEPALPEALRGATGPANARRTYLVYFGDADPAATRRDLLASGALVVSYIPDHTFLVRAPESGRVSTENGGGWVGAYQPAYKLSPRLAAESAPLQTVSVLVFPDGDLDRVTAAARALGAGIQASSSN